ncbi:hypothetical protein D3C72_1190910 [compost metagenome]
MPLLLIEQRRAQCDQARQAFAPSQNRHVGGRTALGHAQPGDALLAQLQQIGGGQFMGRDDGAGRHVVMPGIAEQYAQHPLLEVAQVVGTFGEQCAAGLLEHFALRFDGLVPGVGRGRALVDGLTGSVQQGRIFEQRQVCSENGLLSAVLVFFCLGQGVVDFAAHLAQCRVQNLALLLRIMLAGIHWQADRIQTKQRPADQAGRRADAVQHTGFDGAIALGDRRWRGGVTVFGQGCG